MNVLTKKLFICVVTTYIYEMERQKRLARLGTLPTSKKVLHVLNVPESLPKLSNLNFGRRCAANLPSLNWGRNN